MKLAFWKKEQSSHAGNGQSKSRRESDARHSRKIKILMVDDEVSFTRLTKRNLEAEGFQVHTENKARQALPAAKVFKPDIILLDVMMPGGKDGFTVLCELRKDPATRDIPVIMLSSINEVTCSSYDEEILATYLGYAPSVFLEKPVRPQRLLKEVAADDAERQLVVLHIPPLALGGHGAPQPLLISEVP